MFFNQRSGLIKVLAVVFCAGLLSACGNKGPQTPVASGTGTDGDIYSAAVDSLDGAYDTRIGEYTYDANAPVSSYVNNAPARSPGFQSVSSDGRTIYFDLDSTRVQSDALPTLQQHAQAIKSSGRRVTLYGHTDKQGSAAYNQSLGERRNVSVARALASYGVPASQISTVSYGEQKPAVRGNNESAYMKNRRVEINY